MRRALLRVVLPLTLLAAGWQTLHRLAAAQIAELSTDPENLVEALRWDPTHPELHYALGRKYLNAIWVRDLSRALEHFERAVQLNPHHWRARLQLAKTYELVGRPEHAEQEYRNAVGLKPLSADYRWRTANFYLRNRNMDRALEELQNAMIHDGSYVEPSFVLLFKAGLPAERMRAALPDDARSQRRFLEILCELDASGTPRAEPAFLREQWSKVLDTTPPPTQWEGGFWIRHLLRTGHADDARTAWIDLAARNGIRDAAFEAASNRVWNGGFEDPLSQVWGTPGWDVPDDDAYTVERAEREGVDGTAGLRLSYHRSKNVEQAGLRQLVVVEPGASYELGFRARSESLTTDRGVFAEVVDPASGRVLARSDEVWGSKPWKRYSARFEAPSGSPVLLVRLAREPSHRLESLLGGTLWIDEVELRPVSAGSAP